MSDFDPCGDFSTKEICAAYQKEHPPTIGVPTTVAAKPASKSVTTHVAVKPKSVTTQLPHTGGVAEPIAGVGLALCMIGAVVSRLAHRRTA